MMYSFEYFARKYVSSNTHHSCPWADATGQSPADAVGMLLAGVLTADWWVAQADMAKVVNKIATIEKRMETSC